MTDIKKESVKLKKIKKLKSKLAASKIVSQGPIDEVESDLVTESDNVEDEAGAVDWENQTAIEKSDIRVKVRGESFKSHKNVKEIVQNRLSARKMDKKDHHIQMRIPAKFGEMYKAITPTMKKALKDVYIEALVEMYSSLSVVD